MLSNFAKIFIKYSLFLFIFLSEIQEIFCMDDEMTGLLAKSPSIARTKKDKENSREVENIGLDIRVAEWSSSRRPLHPANQIKSGQSRYHAPRDLGVPIAGAKADVKILTQNKRPRPDFSLSPEESSEDPVPESKSLTLFDVLDPREACEVQILNAALYKKSEVLSMDVDLASFTPTKINAYREAGGTTPELKTKIDVLKTLYPKEIKDIEHFPRQHDSVFSPAVRNLPRETVGELRAQGLVFHLPDFATAEPLVIETEEQRAARKEKQKKEFEASERILGNLPKQLISEREKILKPWVPYFNYVEMKKNQYAQGIGEKMRWPELGEAFMKYVAPHMKFLEIEGFEVYFSLKVINFKRKNPKKQKENHEIMREGLAPTGVDGNLVHLHHVLQICARSHPMKVTDNMRKNRESPYKLIYVPDFIHTEYTEFLHPVNYVTPKEEINRSSFGKSRKVIHKKVVELEYSPK